MNVEGSSGSVETLTYLGLELTCAKVDSRYREVVAALRVLDVK